MDVLLKCDTPDAAATGLNLVAEPAFPCRSMDTLWIAVLLEHLVILIRFICSSECPPNCIQFFWRIFDNRCDGLMCGVLPAILIGSETSKPSVISSDEFKEQ